MAALARVDFPVGNALLFFGQTKFVIKFLQILVEWKIVVSPTDRNQKYKSTCGGSSKVLVEVEHGAIHIRKYQC